MSDSPIRLDVHAHLADWPFAMGLSQPRRQLEGVAPALLARILQDNGAALLQRHGEKGAGP